MALQRSLQHLLLTVAFLTMPLVSVAQINDNCAITIADGTESSQYVPIYGYYCDEYQRCQMLIKASDIEVGQFMTDVTHRQYVNTIRSMTFYLDSSAAGSWGNARFQVRLREVPADVTVIGNSYQSL